MTELRIDITVEDTVYEKPTAWRLLGAKGKSKNIVSLCEKNGIIPKNLLEVGAGDGSILRSLSEKCFCDDMHAVEISKSGVEVILSQNISGLKSCEIFDGYNIPFSDGEFDLVILSHVLEHVEYERALLREIVRVSKFQIIEIPMDCNNLHDEIYHALGPSYGHINAHSPDSLRFLLTTENMVVLEDQIGRYKMDLLEYDYFVNNTHEQSDVAVREFRRRYQERESRFNALPRADKIKSSNYYTVLTRAETPEERIMRAVSATKKAIAGGQVQASRLIFNHFVPSDRRDDFALEVATECAAAQPDMALEYLDMISLSRSSSQDVVKVRNVATSARQAAVVTSQVKAKRASRTWIARTFPFLTSIVKAMKR